MQPEDKKNKAEEPAGDYGKKRLTFFNSFEEEQLYRLKEMAAQSYETRLGDLETLRRRFVMKGKEWKPLKRVITIIQGLNP